MFRKWLKFSLSQISVKEIPRHKTYNSLNTAETIVNLTRTARQYDHQTNPNSEYVFSIQPMSCEGYGTATRITKQCLTDTAGKSKYKSFQSLPQEEQFMSVTIHDDLLLKLFVCIFAFYMNSVPAKVSQPMLRQSNVNGGAMPVRIFIPDERNGPLRYCKAQTSFPNFCFITVKNVRHENPNLG